MTNDDKKTTYLTVGQIAKRHPFLTESGWRAKIFYDKDFNKKCVRRFGRRVLLNEEKVLKYIDDSNN